MGDDERTFDEWDRDHWGSSMHIDDEFTDGVCNICSAVVRSKETHLGWHWTLGWRPW